MRSLFQNILLIFFFLLPFHAFGVTFLNALFFDVTTPAPLLLSAWKEIFLGIFFLCSGFWMMGHFQQTKKEFDYIDSLIVLLSLVGLVVGLWHGESLMQVILGIKYDYFFLWIFFCCKHLPFSSSFLKKFQGAILIAGLFAIIFGLIQKFSLPNFLIQFGYFDAPSVDTAQKPASFCQLLEGTNTCRIQSFFAGPIRFGAFLVLLSSISIQLFFHEQKERSISLLKKGVGGAVLLLCCVLLIWTYSRGAWIAEIILLSLSLALYFRIPLFSWKTIASGLFAGCIAIGIIVSMGKADSFLLREGSTGEHWQGVVESWEIIKSEPTGQGLGTAGAASANMGDEYKFLNENWYLQMFTELGIAGGIIYLLLTFSVGYALYRKKSDLFPVFMAFSVMALFTHLWEESSIAFILWAMLGITLNEKTHRKT